MADPTLPGIRQSDAAAFRRCRQLWQWSSALRDNLMPDGDPVSALWLGTGGHFALEDYHGYNYFGDPRAALAAYADAHTPRERPSDWAELITLGQEMLGYYADTWLPRRDTLQTLWIDGVPQVELTWTLPLPGVAANQTGTFDRLATDEYDRIWIVDYKFNRAIDLAKLENDPQITTYLWAAQQLFPGRVEGLAYIQLAKVAARAPAVLKSGGFSQAKSAPVTYGTYVKTLMDAYGAIPPEYQSHVNYLAATEDADGDQLIRRSMVRRNSAFIAGQDWNIKAQAQEMIYPALAIYPNPGRDCSYCAFRSPCLAKMNGQDPRPILAASYLSRNTPQAWKTRLAYPGSDATDEGAA